MRYMTATRMVDWYIGQERKTGERCVGRGDLYWSERKWMQWMQQSSVAAGVNEASGLRAFASFGFGAKHARAKDLRWGDSGLTRHDGAYRLDSTYSVRYRYPVPSLSLPDFEVPGFPVSEHLSHPATPALCFDV